MTPRERMIQEIRVVYGLDSPLVFSAMHKVLREQFVPAKYSPQAYSDSALSIGFGQTISQPYTVAFMTNLALKAKNKDRVLEIGTGSGYQAAVLSHLFKQVYSVEIIPQLVKRSRNILKRLGYRNIKVKEGSGEAGWKEYSLFDAILITAGIEGKAPQALFEQLKDGGILVAPIGKGTDKVMTSYLKIKGREVKAEEHGIFNFVPFIRNVGIKNEP